MEQLGFLPCRKIERSRIRPKKAEKVSQATESESKMDDFYFYTNIIALIGQIEKKKLLELKLKIEICDRESGCMDNLYCVHGVVQLLFQLF